MPKPRRDSAAGADTRPAFARPPRANGNSPATTPSPAAKKVSSKPKAKHSPATSPVKKTSGHATGAKRHGREGSPTKDKTKYVSSSSADSSSHALSADSLAKLNALNEKLEPPKDKSKERPSKEKQYKDLGEKGADHNRHRKKKNRDVSGALLEEGRAHEKRTHVRHRGGGGAIIRRRGGNGGENPRRKKIWILIGIVILLLVIIIPVAVVESNKHNGGGGGSSNSTSGTPSNSNLNGMDPNSIPAAAKGTYLDPFSWYDTTDFNVTYTNDTVGGLPVMGLNKTWDDSARPNNLVPPLNENFTYGKMPIRGVNIGGWLSLEPFITPSLFSYPASDNVVDEYTLCQKLGSNTANQVLEKHYATFVTEQTFIDIVNAGMDHVRIPYSYWAVVVYPGDPYVFRTSWRYLLRGIEWARKHGLRVNLDLHALPGSQNGWNHSGRQGTIGWLNGTDGDLNAQRSVDVHDQLSQFFAQPRYKNVVTIYGLCNEPKMISLPTQPVLDWTTNVTRLVRKNGLEALVAFSDGFLALTEWHGQIENVDPNMVQDTHQYAIFNTDEIHFTHQNKISLACSGWSGIISAAVNPSTGWGPTLCGEFSQADTDCAQNLNNVNVGSRWTGTMNTQDPSTRVLSPTCPSQNPPCDCTPANADPSQYSDSYKQFLQMFAEAQIFAFEKGWGWFYWTWETESATQWSWKLGLQAGILPEKAYAPSFTCNSSIPNFSDLPENY